MRTKASVHTLSGHTNAVATVRCQAAEPQIITGTCVRVRMCYDYTCTFHIHCDSCFVSFCVQCFFVHLKSNNSFDCFYLILFTCHRMSYTESCNV